MRSFQNTELLNLSELRELFTSCSFKFCLYTELRKNAKYQLWFDHE